MPAPISWTLEEAEVTVADYLHMWLLEQSGQNYSKTAHRNALLKKLNNRSAAAIELKHQNISAVLMEHGWQNISGYKPRGNYQRLLAEVVATHIMQDRQFDHAAEAAADQPAIAPLLPTFDGVLVNRPKYNPSVRMVRSPYLASSKPQLNRDYLDREARNASLGKAGEEFVMAYEQRRLHDAGKKMLANKVEHVSLTQGDGLGFDVQSFDIDGRERFIEVKTTAWGKETPFFISRNELTFSNENRDQFHLYRVFDFRKSPHLFDLHGAVENHCLLDPITYVAKFS